jgi:hypothetical protein
MNRRFGFGWIWALGTLVIASIVGVIAFIAGHATEAVSTNPEVGRAVNDGYAYGHFGFFPFFGFLWFLLIVFLLFAVFRRGMGWKRGYWGGGPGGGYWHQHSHEPGGPTAPTAPTTPPAGGEPEQPKSV